MTWIDKGYRAAPAGPRRCLDLARSRGGAPRLAWLLPYVTGDGGAARPPPRLEVNAMPRSYSALWRSMFERLHPPCDRFCEASRVPPRPPIATRDGSAGPSRRASLAVWTVMVAALALWPLTSCQSLAADLAPSGAVVPGGAIPLQVVKDGTGSVLVFVAVSIQGQGPYTFVLDTGASRTVIDQRVADSLQLDAVPAIPIASDVSGAVQARIVRVRDWRAGDLQ